MPSTTSRSKALGLDPFKFYFLGRGGVLGDVPATVVNAAFGYYNPDVLAAVWDAARKKVDPVGERRRVLRGRVDFARERLAGLEELDGFVAAARKVIDRARTQVSGLALFAGAATAPLPEDPAAAAMHALIVLRELRGSVHLVAVVAEGLDPKVAHFVRRPEMFTTFGWAEADAPSVGDGEAGALAAADARTDELLAPFYGVLDDDDAVALLAGLAAIAPRLRGDAHATSA